MKKLNFAQSGFSIMEVMIAAGLLGIVTVGVMQVTKNMTKSSKTDAQRVEFAQVTNQIQALLRDEYSCEETLGGLSPSGSGSNVPVFKRRKPDGSTADVLTAGQAYGSGGTPIFLKKMEIKNYNAASGIAELLVTMNRGRKDFDAMTPAEKDTVKATSYGTAVVPQILKVQVILDSAGKIKDCISDKDDYTSGACAMINGDWTDKVKCKSIRVQGNGVAPSITADTNVHVKSGLNVGSTLSGDPGNGNITLSNDLDVKNKATVKSDTTITTGKLIFNDGDASIAQVAGSNLYVQNKAGTGNANLIVGRTGNARTTITPTSVTVNKNGTIGAGLALEVIGNTTLTGSGSTTVTLKVGNADIQYNGTNLVLRKPSTGVVQYADGSTIEEVASQGFVNAQLGKALTGNSATLTTILSNLGTLVSGNPIQAISASTCGFYTNMVWNGTRCVDNRNTDCPANQMMIGFNNGAPECRTYTKTSQTCSGGNLFMGYDANGNGVCNSAANEIGPWVDGRITEAANRNQCQVLHPGATFTPPANCRWGESRNTSGGWSGCTSSCGGCWQPGSWTDQCHWSSDGCGGTCGWAWENHCRCNWPQSRTCNCNISGTSCSASCTGWSP